MVADFRSKLNFEPKQVQFIEKIYTLKTDHKTGLLLQQLFKENADSDDADEKTLKLVLGDKQYKELMEELEAAGNEKGAVNYTENMQSIVFGVMSVLYNRPFEEFSGALNSEKK